MIKYKYYIKKNYLCIHFILVVKKKIKFLYFQFMNILENVA